MKHWFHSLTAFTNGRWYDVCSHELQEQYGWTRERVWTHALVEWFIMCTDWATMFMSMSMSMCLMFSLNLYSSVKSWNCMFSRMFVGVFRPYAIANLQGSCVNMGQHLGGRRSAEVHACWMPPCRLRQQRHRHGWTAKVCPSCQWTLYSTTILCPVTQDRPKWSWNICTNQEYESRNACTGTSCPAWPRNCVARLDPLLN